MKATLYTQAKEIEELDEKIIDLNCTSQIDVAELQRNLFQTYVDNPVFYNATQGKQSIENCLQELGQINNGIRKILPWEKNEEHNEKLNHLGELVPKPYHIHTSGIFMPNNVVTTSVEVTAICFGASYLISKYFMTPNLDVNPEEIQQTMLSLKTSLPIAMSILMVPIVGFLTNSTRFTVLPTNEAKYLDGKIQEFYK